MGFSTTEDQDWLFIVLSKFFLSCQTNCSLILSGFAGTGKTTCINSIVKSAEGIGLKYKNKYLGNFGDLSTFSFYSNKLITTGEGGCILTNKKEYYNRCISLRNLSFGKKIRFKHNEISNNYRMSSLQCAYGISEMKFFNSNIKQKIKINQKTNKKTPQKQINDANQTTKYTPTTTISIYLYIYIHMGARMSVSYVGCWRSPRTWLGMRCRMVWGVSIRCLMSCARTDGLDCA